MFKLIYFKLKIYFYIYIYIYIYEQYNLETARRNTPKLKHSIPIEKMKHLSKRNWQPCYFQGRPTHTLTRSIFMGDFPSHSDWSIFMGDLPTHFYPGLFSRATSPYTHTVYFHGRPALTLTLVYFHGQPTHACLSWSIFKGDLPFWLGLTKILFGHLEPKCEHSSAKLRSPPTILFT